MQKIILATIAVFALSFSAYAEKGKDISEKKTKLLEKITKRVDCMNKKLPLMQEFKTCVEAANDKAALKKCRQDNRGKIKALKESGCGHMRK